MNDLYVVLITVVVIWLGVFVYLVSLDRKVSRLSRGGKRDAS
jgi:CcmD family protein